MGVFQTLTAVVVLIFTLCVIVQAVQEIVKSVLGTKAGAMEKTIMQFMGEHLTLDQVNKAMAARGLDLAELEHFSKDDFRHLLDGIDLTAPQVAGLVKTATATVEDAKNNIAAAYDGARAKFQKAYAKKNKIFALVISFLVVMILNSNLIMIYDQLATDQVMAQAIVGHAGQTVCSKAGLQTQQSGAGPASAAAEKNLKDVYTDNRDCISQVLKDYPVLFRWREQGSILLPMYLTEKGDGGAFRTLLGLLAMALLVSLGAPFWNDVLKGVTGVNNVLNSGPKTPS
jgi:hypothetical protein